MIKFTHRINFLKNLSVHAIENDNWQLMFHSYADIMPICEARAGEVAGLSFGNVISEELFLFRTRFHPDINKNLRISFDNDIYEIKRIVKLRDNQRSTNIIAFKIGEEK